LDKGLHIPGDKSSTNLSLLFFINQQDLIKHQIFGFQKGRNCAFK